MIAPRVGEQSLGPCTTQGGRIGRVTGAERSHATNRRTSSEVHIAHEVEKLVSCGLVSGKRMPLGLNRVLPNDDHTRGWDMPGESESQDRRDIALERERSSRCDPCPEVGLIALPPRPRGESIIREHQADLHVDSIERSELVATLADINDASPHHSSPW